MLVTAWHHGQRAGRDIFRVYKQTGGLSGTEALDILQDISFGLERLKKLDWQSYGRMKTV